MLGRSSTYFIDMWYKPWQMYDDIFKNAPIMPFYINKFRLKGAVPYIHSLNYSWNLLAQAHSCIDMYRKYIRLYTIHSYIQSCMFLPNPYQRMGLHGRRSPMHIYWNSPCTIIYTRAQSCTLIPNPRRLLHLGIENKFTRHVIYRNPRQYLYTQEHILYIYIQKPSFVTFKYRSHFQSCTLI